MSATTRFIPKSPILSRFEGCCGVCKQEITQGELISPFFLKQYNLWRHTDCYQLFYLNPVKYEGNCKDCRKNIDFGCDAYWSKHNGIWCMDCSKKLYPKVVVSTSLFSISRTVVKKEKAVS